MATGARALHRKSEASIYNKAEAGGKAPNNTNDWARDWGIRICSPPSSSTSLAARRMNWSKSVSIGDQKRARAILNLANSISRVVFTAAAFISSAISKTIFPCNICIRNV